MASANRQQHHKGRGHVHISLNADKRLYIGIILALAIIYLLIPKGGARSISSATTFNVTTHASVVRTPYGDYAMYVRSTSPGSGSVQLYLSKLPAIANPLLNVTLQREELFKLNAGSAFTNLEITLVSTGTDQARITLTPVDPSLAIAPQAQGVSAIKPYLSFQSIYIPIN